MRYFYDTEFIEDGKTVDLLSIGIDAEDGRQYYAVASDAPWKRVKKNPWLMANVVPHLPQAHGDARNHQPKAWLFNYNDPCVKPREQIAGEVADFILGKDRHEILPDVELWADYAAYDHVVLAQLFGRMIDLPQGMPMFTHDIQQEARHLGVESILPGQQGSVHNAIEDARHVRRLWFFLRDKADV